MNLLAIFQRPVPAPANPGRALALKQHADQRAYYRAKVDEMNRQSGRPAVRWPGTR